MKRKLVIKYHWTNDEGIEPIPEMHQEALEEDALDRIAEQLKEGNWCGELSSSVRFGKDRVPEEDEEDGLNYSGWWEVKRKEVKQ